MPHAVCDAVHALPRAGPTQYGPVQIHLQQLNKAVDWGSVELYLELLP